MGLKDLFSKFSKNSSGFVYIVNKQIFRQFIEEDIAFATEHELEAVEEFYLYVNGDKELVTITNLDADALSATKGLLIAHKGFDYTNFDGFFEHIIEPIPGEYFKIELTWSDNKTLNEFKKDHPELKPEDY